MNLIEPSVKILTYISPNCLKDIELAARTCYRSYDKITDDSAESLILNLKNRNHTAMFEFVDVTVRFNISRAIANEIVRHRLCSYAQSSTRYIVYRASIDFILPLNISKNSTALKIFTNHCKNCEEVYHELLGLEIKPVDARDVLPLALSTELVMKTNLREWIHFFELRTDRAAHPEMRRIVIPLLELFKEKIPVIFG